MKRVRATTGWRRLDEGLGGLGPRSQVEPLDIHLGDADDDAGPRDAVTSYCGIDMVVIDDEWHNGVGKCTRCVHVARRRDGTSGGGA